MDWLPFNDLPTREAYDQDEADAMIENRKKTILLADDDSSFRFAMATELRSLGYLVVSAEDGQRAMGMMRESCAPFVDVDLVITDLVMPRKNGIRFCRELREVCEEIPILVITGFMSADIKQALGNMGCTEYLEKPFSPEDLVKKVQKLLGEGEKDAGGI